MLFDPGCVICACSHGPVCASCAGRLRRRVVGSSTAVDGVDAARAAFELDAWSRPLITALKYRGQRRVARWLGREMAMLVPLAVDVVTWVPTTPERRQRRGYDHAEQLARSVAVAAGLPVQRLLGRAPGDQRQTEQSRRDRLTGPRILPVRAVGGMVLVVDDVLTTGSTARVSAAVLRRAGAERVIALTAAQTPRRRHRGADTAAQTRHPQPGRRCIV